MLFWLILHHPITSMKNRIFTHPHLRSFRMGILPVFMMGMLSAQTVEDRVDVLEKKMDRILELLEKKDNPAPDKEKPAPAAAEAEAKAKETVKAPVVNDKTVLVNGCSLKAFLVTKESYETEQIGDPVVNIMDKGANFTMGNFLATPASKTFERHQMGLKWEGYLWIDAPGKYMFTATSLKRVYGNAVLHVSLNGNNLLKTNMDQRAPGLGTITISSPGAYYLEVWLGGGQSGMNQVSFGLEYGTIGATKMNKISPSTLYSKK